MRLALDRIKHSYQNDPRFQDLLESTLATAVLTGGQAIFTDLTPEQLALAGSVTFGASMLGRPAMGFAGRHLGKAIDKRYPRQVGVIHENIQDHLSGHPLGGAMKAKLAPYDHLGGVSRYLDPFGRIYGDEVAQTIAAFGMPAVLGNDDPSGI